MKNYKWSFKIKKVNKNCTQYDDLDLSENEPVEAVYVDHNIIGSDNPFIAALPPAKEDTNVLIRNYTKSIFGYDFNKVKNMTNNEKIAEVNTLRTNLRVCLPFQKQLEDEFLCSLITTYNSRNIYKDSSVNIPITIKNKEEVVHQKLFGNPANSTNSSFALLGFSGCGKSTSLNQMIGNYPQLIIHQTPEGEKIPQIVYLVVNCIPNSNFNQLYISIGKAIDRALGNIEPVYEELIRKERSLSNKMAKVIRFIEIFNIGAIILDEIQLIDFKHTKENSFEGLMTIANDTKVSIAVVGTEDAYKKMFINLRNARRIGALIDASCYTSNYPYFKNIASFIMKYQWFNEYITPTEEMIEALYKNTYGIIDQLISLYVMMNVHYIEAKGKKPEINAGYIEKISKKYFPSLQNLNNSLNTYETDKLFKESNEEITSLLNDILQKSKKENEKMMQTQYKSELVDDVQILEKNIMKKLSILGYAEDKIDKAFKKFINNTEDYKSLTETEILQGTISYLNVKKPTKKRNVGNKPSYEEMARAIGGTYNEPTN